MCTSTMIDDQVLKGRHLRVSVASFNAISHLRSNAKKIVREREYKEAAKFMNSLVQKNNVPNYKHLATLIALYKNRD